MWALQTLLCIAIAITCIGTDELIGALSIAALFIMGACRMLDLFQMYL